MKKDNKDNKANKDIISELASQDKDTNIYDYTIEKFIEENKNYFGPSEINKLETSHWIMQHRYIVLKYLIKNMIISKNIKSLDLGIGSGLLSNEINKLSSYYKGIDKDVDSVKYAIKNFDLNAHMLEMPEENINKEEILYDYIFALNFIEYQEDLDRVLFQIHKSLNNKGFFILSVPSDKYTDDMIDEKNNDKIKHKFSYKKIEEVLNNNKFKVQYYTFYQNYSILSLTTYLHKEALNKKTSKITKDNFFESLKETIGETLINKDLLYDVEDTDTWEDLTIINPKNNDILRASLSDLRKIQKEGSINNGKQIFIVARKMTKKEYKNYSRSKENDTTLDTTLSSLFNI